MAPTYKVGYFNGKGRAEVTRYVFKVAGVEFEDLRFDGDTWRAEWKDKTPFLVAPFLMIDDKMISDSGAMNRYLAKKFGMMGETEWDEAIINQTLGIIEDVIQGYVQYRFRLQDEKAKEEAQAKFKAEIVPKFHKYIENLVQSSGFLIGSKLSLADLAAFDVLTIPGNIDEAPEKVKAFHQKIADIPAMAKWIQERPETTF